MSVGGEPAVGGGGGGSLHLRTYTHIHVHTSCKEKAIWLQKRELALGGGQGYPPPCQHMGNLSKVG